MAGIGRRGSYLTDAPIQNAIGDALGFVENQQFRYKAEDRLKKDAIAKKLDDDLKEYAEYQNKFGVNITGNEKIDDTTTKYAMSAKQQAGDLTRQIQQTTDFNKKADLMAKRAKIVQSFDVLKQIPEMMIAQAKDIAEGVEKGKYSDRDVNIIQEKLKAIETGAVHYYTDDAGNLRFTTFKRDENGNPTGIIDKDETVAGLIQSLKPNLKSAYDTNNGIAEQFVSTVKQDEKSIQNGYTTITQKGDFNGRIKNLADAKGKEIADIPYEAYEIWQRMGNPRKTNFTPEEKVKIAEYVSKDLQNRYGTEYKKDIDQSGILARETANKKDKKEKIESVITSANDVVFVDEIIGGDKVKSTIIDNSRILPNALTLSKPVKITKIGKEGTGLNNVELTTIALSDTGKIIYSGSVVSSKSGSSKFVNKDGTTTQTDTYNQAPTYKKIARQATGETEGIIASSLGYDSVGELKSYLKKINEGQEPTTKKETPAERAQRIANGG